MYILVIIVHVIVCLFLIAVILLQAGRGGGLSDMAGGGQPQSILGTQANVFMTRVTEVCAVSFVVTSLTLGVMTTHRGKSLFEKEMAKHALKTALPPISQTAPAKTADSAVGAETAPQSGRARVESDWS